MSKITKKSSNKITKEPVDLVFTTILIDESSSMQGLERKVIQAVDEIKKKIGGRPEVQISVHKFAKHRNKVIPFGTEGLVNSLDSMAYRPNGGTRLFGSLLEAIKESREEAALVKSQLGMATHHLFAIITDGEDTDSNHLEVSECRDEIQRLDVSATWILLDFSHDGQAGEPVGLKGIPALAGNFSEVMKSLIGDLEQVADNVMKRLPPDHGLKLLPGGK